VSEFLAFTVIGIVTGAAYAVAASGLVVTYATSGIFNFAHGAIGMIMAYTFWQLVDGWHWPIFPAALVVVFVLAPVFGALVEVGLIRRVRGQSLATTLVVTVSVLVFLIGVADWIWGGTTRPAPSFFGRSGFHLAKGVFVTWHEAITILVAVGVAVFLRLFLYRTRVGISMRAVVDNRELLALNGARPARTSTLSWALGASLAALAGILIAPILNDLSVLPLTFLVVYAYGAAMLGRLRNLPLTFLGALLLGLGYSYSVGYLPTTGFWGSTPVQGLRQSLPVLLLFVVLIVMRQDTIERGRLTARSHHANVPGLTRSVSGGVVLVVAVAVVVSLISPEYVVDLGVSLAYAVIMLSLVPLAGWGGQVSLCQMTFAGLGAFAMARVAGGGSLLGLFAALGLAGAVGALIALPALRLRGLYLALATFAFAIAMDNMFFPTSVAFSFNGSIHIGRPSIFGLHMNSDHAFVVFLAVVFALLGIGLLALRRGPFGRLLHAMKDSETACTTLGLSLTTTKLAVFGLSAAIAGLGGALFGAMVTQAGGTDFASEASLPILLLVVLGGIGSVTGALYGGFAYGIGLALLAKALPTVPDLSFIATGLAGLSIAYMPQGVAVRIAEQLRERLSFLSSSSRAAGPAPEPPPGPAYGARPQGATAGAAAGMAPGGAASEARPVAAGTYARPD